MRRATKHTLCRVELLRHFTVLEMINSNGSTHVTWSPTLLVTSRRRKWRKFDPRWVNYRLEVQEESPILYLQLGWHYISIMDPLFFSDTKWSHNENCWNNTDTGTPCQFVHHISQSDRSGAETRCLCWEIWSVAVQRYTLSAVLTSDMKDCCRCNSAQEELLYGGGYQTGADRSLVRRRQFSCDTKYWNRNSKLNLKHSQVFLTFRRNEVSLVVHLRNWKAALTNGNASSCWTCTRQHNTFQFL